MKQDGSMLQCCDESMEYVRNKSNSEDRLGLRVIDQNQMKVWMQRKFGSNGPFTHEGEICSNMCER